MKATLRLSRNISTANDNHSKTTPRSTVTELSNQQWHTPNTPPSESWTNAQPDPHPTYKHTTDLAGLMTTKKPNLLKKHLYTTDLTATPNLKTIAAPATRSAPLQYSDSPEIWLFCSASQNLCNISTCIQLTAIEALLVKTLSRSDARICSKQELIISINKDIYSYSGLEMCLSRLQSKFRAVFGERLFRSVRNRGYCLVQDVRIND